jgi:hypothetical protein
VGVGKKAMARQAAARECGSGGLFVRHHVEDRPRPDPSRRQMAVTHARSAELFGRVVDIARYGDL